MTFPSYCTATLGPSLPSASRHGVTTPLGTSFGAAQSVLCTGLHAVCMHCVKIMSVIYII